MARTSIVHYISPSALSISPNANGSANDLAVFVADGTKIKVYSPQLSDLIPVNGDYKEWDFTGRNRRLNDSNVPYTIYARLTKNDNAKGYLVFAPKRYIDGEWRDKYNYIIATDSGLSTQGYSTDDGTCWYIRLGDVSLPVEGLRTVAFDTGILGTEQYNVEMDYEISHTYKYQGDNVRVDRGLWHTPPETKTDEYGTYGEPYHCNSLTVGLWRHYRLDSQFAGLTDEELLAMLDRWKVDRETSRVWNYGVLWECLVDGTTDEPKWDCSDWFMVAGNDNLSIEFVSSRGYSFRRGYVDTVITPHLFYGSTDITDEIDAEYWTWTRASESGKTVADEAWDAVHTGLYTGVKTLRLTNNDMPASWSSANKAIFTCTVSFRDGSDTRIVDNQIIS